MSTVLKSTRKSERAGPARGAASAPLSLCILGDDPISLWGLSGAERATRLFRQAGVAAVIGEEALETHNGPVIVMRADAVIDPPLAAALVARPDWVLTSNFGAGGEPVAAHATPATVMRAKALVDGAPATDGSQEADRAAAGLTVSAPEGFGGLFWEKLRKRETPYAIRLTPENRAGAQWRIFMGTYKGATDFVTKHVWPLPAFHATRFLGPRNITPNMVTALSAVFVVAAYFCFENGYWWTGLAAAWLMTFLDTVDGKLARVTLTSSKWGDIFDHGIDLVHPPFWYAAWAIGVWNSPHQPPLTIFLWAILIILIGYLLQRMIEGVSIKYFGLEIHIWRPVDTFFRQITARRNPNLVIMTLSIIAARPDLGLIGVAAWTAVCLVLHGVQIVQASAAVRRDGSISSWMSKPA